MEISVLDFMARKVVEKAGARIELYSKGPWVPVFDECNDEWSEERLWEFKRIGYLVLSSNGQVLSKWVDGRTARIHYRKNLVDARPSEYMPRVFTALEKARQYLVE